MSDKTCWICSGEGADTICPRCGNIVCRDCYDEENKICLECAEEAIDSKIKRKRMMLVGGILLIIIGLSTAAAGLVSGLPTEGVTVVFPFIVGEVSPFTAGLYSFLFFTTIACASLLPWYIHTRRGEAYTSEEDVTIMEGKMMGGEGFEHVEYVITAELPKKLEKTILVETRGTAIHLHSSADKEFKRIYQIPENHDLESFDYDYDEGYLVLKLNLVRLP